MEKKKPKQIFTQGPIAPDFIATSIAKHSTQTAIGGHSIFLGQVRSDAMGDQTVAAIEYTSYEDLALETMHAIREDIFGKYELTCMHIHHSLGTVKAGEICLFVFTSSKHRRAAMDACSEVTERIKKELPIWGKEIFADGLHQWKENKF